jgi:sec-independent protein translocase protein TatC
MSIFSNLSKSIREKGEKMGAEMSFFEHLEALRWHLIRSAAVILLITIFAFAFFDQIFYSIIMAPTRNDFWTYRMMCSMGDVFHSIFPSLDPKGFCLQKTIQFDLINTELAGQFNLQLNSSIMIGLILGVPYLLYEIWKFIRPALHDKERKAASGFVFYSSSLFMLGVLFGYYVVTPLSVRFFASYTVSTSIKNIFAVDSFISSETMLTLLAGLVFQLPIVVYILSSLGILTPKFMRDKRRYAVILILVLAAIITPSPDALTMMVVALPLYLLFEFSITVSAVVQRRRKKRDEEWMKQ